MKVKRIIRRGNTNSRVELEDGTVVLVPNTSLNQDHIVDPVAEPAPVPESVPMVATQQSVAERFANLESLVDMVIAGQSPSLIICGDAGTGKSFLVRQRLRKAGLQEQTVTADANDASKAKVKDARSSMGRSFLDKPKAVPKNTYLFVKGYSSPMGLYQVLHNNRQATIVFDDCDSVFKDATSVNILKSALDSYDVRMVSWMSTATDKMGLDNSFEFKGKIIFISNLPLPRLDTAVKSRSFSVEISLTRIELWQRMLELLPSIEPSVPMDLKTEVLNHLAYHLDAFTEFNMRTFIKAIRLRQSENPAWRDMVLKFA